MPSLADQLLPQLLIEQFDTLLIQCNVDSLNICMNEFGLKNDKTKAMRTILS